MNAKNIIEFINDYQNGNETALDLLKRQGQRGHDLSNTL